MWKWITKGVATKASMQSNGLNDRISEAKKKRTIARNQRGSQQQNQRGVISETKTREPQGSCYIKRHTWTRRENKKGKTTPMTKINKW